MVQMNPHVDPANPNYVALCRGSSLRATSTESATLHTPLPGLSSASSSTASSTGGSGPSTSIGSVSSVVVEDITHHEDAHLHSGSHQGTVTVPSDTHDHREPRERVTHFAPSTLANSVAVEQNDPIISSVLHTLVDSPHFGNMSAGGTVCTYFLGSSSFIVVFVMYVRVVLFSWATRT